MGEPTLTGNSGWLSLLSLPLLLNAVSAHFDDVMSLFLLALLLEASLKEAASSAGTLSGTPAGCPQGFQAQ